MAAFIIVRGGNGVLISGRRLWCSHGSCSSQETITVEPDLVSLMTDQNSSWVGVRNSLAFLKGFESVLLRMNINKVGPQPINYRLFLVIWHYFNNWLLKTMENWLLNNLIFKWKLHIFLYQTLDSCDVLLFLILCDNMSCSTTPYHKPWITHLLWGSSGKQDSVKPYVGSRATVWNVTPWLFWALGLGSKSLRVFWSHWVKHAFFQLLTRGKSIPGNVNSWETNGDF